jgi:tape measure domain-containing protein
MARYTIDFTTNANRIVREIEEVNRKVAQVARTGKSVRITLDTAPLQTGLNATFRQLDKQIESMQRKLSKLQIGSGAFRSAAASIGFREGQRERGRLIAEPLRLRGQAQSFDEASAVRLNKELQAARIEASQLAPNTAPWVDLQRQIGQINVQLKATDRLAESIQMQESLGAFAPGSLNALEAKLAVLRNRAREIAPDTTEWKQLNKEILDVERGIEKQTRRPLTGGQRLGAAGGAFLYGGGLGGGVGSAVGGIAGGLMGGVPGAFAGAAFGQLADNLGGMAAGATNTAATIQQLQRGLALASIDANDFAEAQKAIAESSNTLVVPIEQVYRQFTQLRVNTKQYNMSVEETQQILEGVVLAVSSVGGSMEDVDGAMRAVVQIFSKGSVQAEELRGQLGERFPGAVVKFAQANKMSFDELQKALEQGQVTVGDFVNFAKKNYEDYAKFSEQLATAPEFAGRRLEKAMNDMQIAIGSVLGPAGAQFQNFATSAIESITDFVTKNKDLLIQVGKDFSILFSGIASLASQAGNAIMKVMGPVLNYIGEVINRLRIMTGTATAASARAEMDAAFAAMKKYGPGRTKYQQGGIGYMSDKIEYDKAAKRYEDAEKQFKAAGGSAAIASAALPKGIEFGGPGAGMSLDTAGGKAPKENKTRLQAYSSKMIEVLRARLKEETLAIQTSDQLNARQKELNIASLEYEYGLKIIEEQLKEVSKEKGKMSAADAKLAMAEANQTAASERSSLKYEYNKAVLGDLSNIAEDYEKKIAELTLSINALNVSEGEATNVQKAELMLFEQLKGVKEKDIPLTEARRKKIMELAAELDRLLGIEKEITREKELSQALEAKRTETGMIGGGLRAGFIGEAASVFEQAMIDTKGDVDYATQLANIETAAMQLRSVFEGLQGAIQGVSSAFANVLTEGVTNMIAGTATAKEVFASFLQSVGQALSQAASQMIATYIAIGIAKMFAGLGGGGGADMSKSGITEGTLAPMRQYTDAAGNMAPNLTFANGGIAPGGFRAFANGGVVSGPTLGLVGEGRYNEAIVPLPDGKSIPVQLGGKSARDLMGGNAPGMPAAPSLNMKFETTKINGVEYVSREQLEMAMAETRRASISGGAKQGMAMTLDKIKQSPSTRSRIGMR